MSPRPLAYPTFSMVPLPVHQLWHEGGTAGDHQAGGPLLREAADARAYSGYYSEALVNICEQREVEYFIVAKQHRNLMNAVRAIPDADWR